MEGLGPISPLEIGTVEGSFVLIWLLEPWFYPRVPPISGGKFES